MNHPKFIVSCRVEEPIRIQRVKHLLRQLNRPVHILCAIQHCELLVLRLHKCEDQISNN